MKREENEQDEQLKSKKELRSRVNERMSEKEQKGTVKEWKPNDKGTEKSSEMVESAR